jgi:hypothetical protein
MVHYNDNDQLNLMPSSLKLAPGPGLVGFYLSVTEAFSTGRNFKFTDSVTVTDRDGRHVVTVRVRINISD